MYKNMTQERYEQMLVEQNGLCAICQGPPQNYGYSANKLMIDHDHRTGEVRGLLCNKCNSGLGMFREKRRHLRSAMDYLEKHRSEIPALEGPPVSKIIGPF